MFLSYGSFNTALDEGKLAIDRQTIRTERAQPQIFRETWTWEGMLLADTPAQLSVLINNLQAKFAIQGQNAGLYFNDASVSSHFLNSSLALGGVRVTKAPSFPVGDGAEYVVKRGYTIVLEADFPCADNILISYHEELTFEGGGGGKFVMIQPLTGPPIRQDVTDSSPYRCTQSGQAVGMFTTPIPNPPVFPSDEHLEARSINVGAPKNINGSFIEFPISWNYVFESASPLAGNPIVR